MGKETAKKLQSLSKEERLAIDARELEQMSEGHVAMALIKLKKSYRELQDRSATTMARIELLEKELIDRMCETGQTSVTYSDGAGGKNTLYMKHEVKPMMNFSATDEQKCEDFFNLLEEEGMGHIGRRTVYEAFNKFRQVVKDELNATAERGDDRPMPPKWEQFVRLDDDYRINMRSS